MGTMHLYQLQNIHGENLTHLISCFSTTWIGMAFGKNLRRSSELLECTQGVQDEQGETHRYCPTAAVGPAAGTEGLGEELPPEASHPFTWRSREWVWILWSSSSASSPHCLECPWSSYPKLGMMDSMSRKSRNSRQFHDLFSIRQFHDLFSIIRCC